MYIDDMEEYPFEGSFYTYGVDESKPLDEQVEEEVLVLKTQCDIQQAQKSDSGGIIISGFNVYFPFDKETGIEIKRGMTFVGDMYGLEVNGKVVSVFPTQLSGCECFVQDLDV